MVRLTVAGTDGDAAARYLQGLLADSNYEAKDLLRDEMSATVLRTLGPDFHIESMTVGKGSVEIVLLISTAYYAISRYKNFVESVELMVSQLKGVASRFFRLGNVTAVWLPCEALFNVAPAAAERSKSSRRDWSALYLVFSNAAMMLVLLWMVVYAFLER